MDWWYLLWFFILLIFPRAFSPVALLAFFALLITARARENEMPDNCWYALWASLNIAHMEFYRPLEKELYFFLLLAGLITRPFITSEYYFSTVGFWCLFVLLIPSCMTLSIGRLTHNLLIVYSMHFKGDGLHLPGLTISWYFIMVLYLAIALVTNLIVNKGYLIGVCMWLIAVAVLHEKMWPYNEDFNFAWVMAWWFLLQTLIFAFAPSMPIPWYAMWVCIVTGTGYIFRPDQTMWQFMMWCVTICILRMVLFYLYLVYVLGIMREDLFPFNLFSDRWKGSSPVWFPISQRRSDILNDSALCRQCDKLTSHSKIIMGSTSYFTKLIEWHEYWTRAELIAMFDQPSPAEASAVPALNAEPSTGCGLCCLLWYSMSPKRRENLILSVRSATPNVDFSGLSRPATLTAGLSVKVWEQRPLSLYSYIQLFWGDIPIGARLLVHRDDIFATPSPSLNSERTGSEEHFTQARKWMQLCQENHKQCNGVGNTQLEPPARMIYVEGGQGWTPGQPPETLKLVQTTEMEPDAQYLALSHCWGPTSEMRFKLLASNVNACFQHIDFEGLSRNMQDAITTTLSLGFSYVWIDSLCIIQKDDSGQETGETAEVWRADWAAEARKMGSVYTGAACTIASTGSSTSRGGCFHDRNLTSFAPCKIGVSSPLALSPSWIYARRDDVFDFERSVDLAPLNTRGWVMQERLLSRRILHFGADLMYWECCCRSASELNPHGYSYKRYPQDFKDSYFPNLKINTRSDVQQAEREGRGISWGNIEAVRRRPPPVSMDPDMHTSNQLIWQLKRGFWRNILKPNTNPWAEDEKSEADGRARAGFRAAFEQLRGGLYAIEIQGVSVGRHSFSQVWYDIVESYSNRKLTSPADKLIAFKGIEDEIARATKFTYLKGLWKEKLTTDLLWFAIEGPGQRLLNARTGMPVAPTWSWASIEGVVALDLLPENSRHEVEEKQTLVKIDSAADSCDDPSQMTITLSAPFLPIAAPQCDKNGSWNIDVSQTGHLSARLFPDVRTPEISKMTDLACVTFLVLEREKKQGIISSSNEDIQGLAVRLVRRGTLEGELDVYERVGYFTTSYMPKSRDATKGRKALMKAEVRKICLTGWSGNAEIPSEGPLTPRHIVERQLDVPVELRQLHVHFD